MSYISIIRVLEALGKQGWIIQEATRDMEFLTESMTEIFSFYSEEKKD